MFLLTLAGDRLDLGRRRWMRGRRVGPSSTHSAPLISGLLFIAIGWLFLRSDGTAGITCVLGLGDPTGLEAGVQQWLTGVSPTGLDLGLLAGVAGALLSVVAGRLRRRRREEPGAAVRAGAENR